MKNTILTIIMIILCTIILAEEPEVLVQDKHPIGGLGTTTFLPLKVTYTISEDKPVSEKGDEIIVTATFEYLTDHPQYIEGEQIKIEIWTGSNDRFEVIKIGSANFILDDLHPKLSTSIKVKYLTRVTSKTILEYSCEVSGRLLHWIPYETISKEHPHYKTMMSSKERMYRNTKSFNFSLHKKSLKPKSSSNILPQLKTPLNQEGKDRPLGFPLLRYSTLKLYPIQIPVILNYNGNLVEGRFTNFDNVTTMHNASNVNLNFVNDTFNPLNDYFEVTAIMESGPNVNLVDITIVGDVTIFDDIVIGNYTETITFEIIDQFQITLSFVTENIENSSIIPLEMIESINVYSFSYYDDWDVRYPLIKPIYVGLGDFLNSYALNTEYNQSYTNPITIQSYEADPDGNIGIEIVLKNNKIHLLDDIGNEGNHPISFASNAQSVLEEKSIWYSLHRPEALYSNLGYWNGHNRTEYFTTNIRLVSNYNPYFNSDVQIVNRRNIGNLYTLQEANRFCDTYNYNSDDDIYIYANFDSDTIFGNLESSFFSKEGYSNNPFIYIYGKVGMNNTNHIWQNDILFHEMGHSFHSFLYNSYSSSSSASRDSWDFFDPISDNSSYGFNYKTPFKEAVAMFFQSIVREESNDSENSFDNLYFEGNNTNIDGTGFYITPKYIDYYSIYTNLTVFEDHSIPLFELNYRNQGNTPDAVQPDISEELILENSAIPQKIINLLWDMYDHYSLVYHTDSSSNVYQETDDDFFTKYDWTTKEDIYSIPLTLLIEGIKRSNNAFAFINYIIDKDNSCFTTDDEYDTFISFVQTYYGLSDASIIPSNTYFKTNNTVGWSMKINEIVNIPEDTNINFGEYGKLIINGTLNIGDNVIFTSEINRGKIIVNGTMNIGDNVKFNNIEIAYEDCQFSIENCIFEDSKILTFKNNDCLISGNDFTNSYLVIDTSNNISISNNIFTSSSNFPVKLMYAGAESPIEILDNDFVNIDEAIDSFNSTYKIYNNQFVGGWMSIWATHKSVGEIGGPNQFFIDQNSYPLVFDHDAFPVKIKYNHFHNTNLNDPFITCMNHTAQHPVHKIPYNEWEVNNLYFEPQNGFNIYPVWDGRNPEGENIVDSLFTLSCEFLENEDYTSATNMFIEIIQNYQNTEYARTSLHKLMSITALNNQDYLELQSLYNTLLSSITDESLSNECEYLANYCNLFFENFSPAINYFENIISNPSTQTDSVYAVLDLGYTFLLMNSDIARYSGRFPDLLPKNRYDFYLLSSNLRQSLLPNTEGSEEIPQSFPFKLQSNYPNPFNPTTKITYELFSDFNIKLEIFNIKGQKVKTLVDEKKSVGIHKIDWNGKNSNEKQVASGVYFYRLSTSNKFCQKKMILLK